MAYYSSQHHQVPYGNDSYGGFFTYASPAPYYYDDFGLSHSGSTMSYSVSASSVPKFVQHTPALSEFRVSYSTPEFNEPEFEEYDPTPYGGGYDPVATYGKPLPPSDRICYQRSTDLGTTTLGSIQSPVKESPAKEEIKVPAAKAEQPHGKARKESAGAENGGGYYYPWAWDDYETQSEYEFESSALGYCGCSCHGHGGGGYCRGESQPNWCGNYLFGCSGYPYGQGRELGGNYPNPVFGYDRHYQEQPLQGQVQYQEPSLLNISTNFLW